MEAKPKEQEGPDGFGRRPRVSAFIRHPLKDLVRNLTIFRQRALGLEDTHDRLKGVAVNTDDALDFLGSGSGMPMKRIAGAMPVASREIDFFLLDQTRDGPDIPKEFRVLPDPADVRAR
jgi:hypothetical protein